MTDPVDSLATYAADRQGHVICGPYTPAYRIHPMSYARDHKTGHVGMVQDPAKPPRCQCRFYAVVQTPRGVIHCGFFPDAPRGGYWKCIGRRDSPNVSKATKNREVRWQLEEELPHQLPTEGLPTRLTEHGDTQYLF